MNYQIEKHISERISAFTFFSHSEKKLKNKQQTDVFQRQRFVSRLTKANVFMFVLSNVTRKRHLNYHFCFWQRFENARIFKQWFEFWMFRYLIEIMIFKFWYTFFIFNVKFAITKRCVKFCFNSTLIFFSLCFSDYDFSMYVFWVKNFFSAIYRDSTFMFFLSNFFRVVFFCYSFFV